MRTFRTTRGKQQSTLTNSQQAEALEHEALLLQQRCLRFIAHREGLVTYLCREVKRITEGRAFLLLSGMNEPSETERAGMSLLPVQCNGLSFGNLWCLPPSLQHEDHSLDGIDEVARSCALVLYLLEHVYLVQRMLNTDALPPRPRLTPQEHRVLTWMGRGQKKAVIATTLGIAEGTVRKHQQHIYHKLDVSCEHDAVIVGYRLGLFSPIEDVSRVSW